MVSSTDVEKALKEGLQATAVEVIDISGGCSSSYEVYVTSPQFEGKKLLWRHQLVNTALAGLMHDIHALSIKRTKTPAEAAQQVA